jgi:hypothetical protein
MSSHKTIRITRARIQKGCVRILGRIYWDKRLRDWNGEQVEIHHDPANPVSVWVVLGPGKGLMASRARTN